MNREVKRCAQCGKPISSLHYGQINGDYYCHTDEEPYPTCYMRASWDRAGELSARIGEQKKSPPETA